MRTGVAARASRVAKRGMDLAMAAVALLVLAPLIPLVALAIKLDSPGPVLFRHPRLGLHGRRIEVTKFRTMVHNAPDRFQADGSRLVTARDARVTRTGRWLRGGIDELPQILSVLKGELSFVGPRPDDVFAVDMYQGTEWLKLAAVPGITGLAQVSGRTDLPWRDRLRLDAYYAAHRTLWLDLRIVARTVAIALGRRGGAPIIDLEVARAYAASVPAEVAALEERSRVRSALPAAPAARAAAPRP